MCLRASARAHQPPPHCSALSPSPPHTHTLNPPPPTHTHTPQWSDLRRAPKPAPGQQPDLLLALRVGKTSMRTPQYQEEVINQVGVWGGVGWGGVGACVCGWGGVGGVGGWVGSAAPATRATV